jgi:hypothetical protein
MAGSIAIATLRPAASPSGWEPRGSIRATELGDNDWALGLT